MFDFPSPLATNRFEDDVTGILARLQRGLRSRSDHLVAHPGEELVDLLALHF